MAQPSKGRRRAALRGFVELTGLRTPCGYIDKFQKGLERAMIVRRPGGVTFHERSEAVQDGGTEMIASSLRSSQ
jgi:hypothetical protein